MSANNVAAGESCIEKCPKLRTARSRAADLGVNAAVAMREVGVLINSAGCERPHYSSDKHSDAWDCGAPNRFAASFDAIDATVVSLAVNARRARDMTEDRIKAYRQAAAGEFTIHRWGLESSGAVLHEVSYPAHEAPTQEDTDGYKHLGDELGDSIVYMGPLAAEEAQAVADQLELSLQS